MAADKVRFGSKPGPSSQKLITQHLQSLKKDVEGYEIAKIDLNEDGISEFILKSKSCIKSKPSCQHTILAQSNAQPVVLGTIDARAIAIGNEYTNGIRNLLAFNDPVNDFKYDVYVWEPAQSQYILLR